jgi:hypothetical protein
MESSFKSCRAIHSQDGAAPDRFEHQLEDSPLCKQCSEVNLAGLVRRFRAGEDVSTDLESWQDIGRIKADEKAEFSPTCRLCVIVRRIDQGYHGTKSGYGLMQSVYNGTLVFNEPGRRFYLVPAERDEVHQAGTSRRQSGVVAREIDPRRVAYSLIRKWLALCASHHRDTCCRDGEEDEVPLPARLKVIDCATRKIIVAPSASEFVALSYVWGSSAANAAVTGLKEGDPLESKMPRVVEDAMLVTLELGFQYLWVDKYCIDQLDDKEKNHFIGRMDDIYARATLTVVDGAGSDADFGLPGVSTTPRREQDSIIVGGMHYLSAGNAALDIISSPWWTRAWTYQEGLLSRRRLIFTYSQVYFQCLEYSWFEALHGEPSERSWSVFPNNGVGVLDDEITDRLAQYSTRQISYESDILNALLGVFRRYEDKNVVHLWGLPFAGAVESADRGDVEQSFAVALCWLSVKHNRKCSRRPGFPSWSWTGWKNLGRLDVPWTGTHGWNPRLHGERQVDARISVHQRAVGQLSTTKMSIAQYSRLILSGAASFAQFEQHIDIIGLASQCQVIRGLDELELDMDLPQQMREKATKQCVYLIDDTQSVRGGTADGLIDSVYLSFQERIKDSTSWMFSLHFLLLRKAVAQNVYTRAGAVEISVEFRESEETMQKGKSVLGLSWFRLINDYLRNAQERWTVKNFRVI